jgi:hypothetical protein
MKIKTHITVSLFFLVFVLLTCCKENKPKTAETTNTETKPLELVQTPDFNSDTAYDFIARQVGFGPRVPNSRAHKACGDFLINTFKQYKAQVTVQSFVAETFDGNKLNSRNIIASYFPKAQRRILLAAHWDTRPFSDQDPDKSLHKKPIDGANDGGSGVGILLEIARILSADTSHSQVGVDLLLFDAEDYGMPEFANEADFPNMDREKQYYCLGSQYWAKNKHVPGYAAYYGVLLDMVGSKNATFFKEGTSMKYASMVTDKVWQIAGRLGYGNYFVDMPANQITDDHVYVNREARIPMTDIIDHKEGNENYFGEYWHTHNDNLQVIDKQTLKAVGQTLLQVIYQERKL